jgi:hypothetical protein
MEPIAGGWRAKSIELAYTKDGVSLGAIYAYLDGLTAQPEAPSANVDRVAIGPVDADRDDLAARSGTFSANAASPGPVIVNAEEAWCWREALDAAAAGSAYSGLLAIQAGLYGVGNYTAAGAMSDQIDIAREIYDCAASIWNRCRNGGEV